MSKVAVSLLVEGKHPALRGLEDAGNFFEGIGKEGFEQPDGTDEQDLMDVYLGQIGIPFLRETLTLIGFHRE